MRSDRRKQLCVQLGVISWIVGTKRRVHPETTIKMDRYGVHTNRSERRMRSL
jgi:hypothetical protein